jgi:uncharacterized protein (TIGR02266 family)
MKVPTEQEFARLEEDTERAEDALEQEIAEAETDVAEVTAALREVKQQLEAEAARAGESIPALEALRRLRPPALPHAAHLARTLEARADALRARMWLVTAMRDDLKRLAVELGEVVRLADEGRLAMQRLEQQRARPRLDRIKANAEDLSATLPPEPAQARRRQPRLKLEAAIDLHSQSNFYTGFTENISDGGVFVATSQRVPLGTEVDIAFTLPTGVEVRGRGVVRWSREETDYTSGGLGVEFEGLSDEARDAIAQFLDAREPIFHPD